MDEGYATGYYRPVSEFNIGKKSEHAERTFINPHTLGAGLRLWEQLANAPGTQAALIVLCAAMPQPRGGGDLDLNDNWHGPERTSGMSPGPMPDEYPVIAKRTIGRWAGDRIALVGDYAEDGDLPEHFRASTIYDRCVSLGQWGAPEGYDADTETMLVGQTRNPETGEWEGGAPLGVFHDITDDVKCVIEHELNGSFQGDGWARFVPDESNHEVKAVARAAATLVENGSVIVSEQYWRPVLEKVGTPCVSSVGGELAAGQVKMELVAVKATGS